MSGILTRFYKSAAIAQAGDGFQVQLDDRPVKTPDGEFLLLPTAEAAQLIADEWDRQGETIGPDDLRLTRLANVAIDKMRAARRETIDNLVQHLTTDLICMRAPHPHALGVMQAEAWDPIIKQLSEKISVNLLISNNLSPPETNKKSFQNFIAAAERLDDFRLCGLAHGSALLGSTALGWALTQGWINADRAMELATVEERHQRRIWGEDSEAAKRETAISRELNELAAFIDAL